MASSDDPGLWTKRDLLKLLESIKSNIPPGDFQAFQKTQADLDWDKVAFKQYSRDMCKLKWTQISHPLRKFRTLTELVLEAKELIEEPGKTEKVKPHPDFPKRPLTAYMRFYKEKRAEYSKKYPKYTNGQLTKVIATEYNQLPEEVKQRYVQDFQKDKQDFQEKLTQFKKQHTGGGSPKKSVLPKSHEIKESKKSERVMKTGKTPPEMALPKAFSSNKMFQGEPKKPPMNAYEKFHQDSWSSPELRHLSFRTRWVEISRRWHRVPQDQRELYKQQAEALQKQYWVKLNRWLQKLSPEEYAAYTEAKASCGKRKNMAISGGRSPKRARTDVHSSSERGLPARPEKEQGLMDSEADSSETTTGHDGGSHASIQISTEDGKQENYTSSSNSSSSGEDG